MTLRRDDIRRGETESLVKEAKIMLTTCEPSKEAKEREFDSLLENQVYLIASLVGYILRPFAGRKQENIDIASNSKMITSVSSSVLMLQGHHAQNQDACADQFKTSSEPVQW